MPNRHSPLPYFFLALGMWGCFDRVAGGAGAGNPPMAEVSIALEAKSTAPVPPAKVGAAKSASSGGNPGGPFQVEDVSGYRILITGIEIRIDRIEFSQPDSATCKAGAGPCLDKEIGLNGDFRMDLISGKSNPEIGVLKVPASLYQEIGLNPAPSDTIPGSSRPRYNLLLSGRGGTVGSERAFAMEIDVEESLDFQSPGGIRIAQDSLTRIRLALSVDNWFQGVDFRPCLEGIAADSAGVSRIRGLGICSGAVQRIGANLQESEDLEEGDEDLEP